MVTAGNRLLPLCIPGHGLVVGSRIGTASCGLQLSTVPEPACVVLYGYKTERRDFPAFLEQVLHYHGAVWSRAFTRTFSELSSTESNRIVPLVVFLYL
jgi:hypothetical protein